MVKIKTGKFTPKWLRIYLKSCESAPIFFSYSGQKHLVWGRIRFIWGKTYFFHMVHILYMVFILHIVYCKYTVNYPGEFSAILLFYLIFALATPFTVSPKFSKFGLGTKCFDTKRERMLRTRSICLKKKTIQTASQIPLIVLKLCLFCRC